ncbi:MAG: TlpA family protein disulfide reductase [Desulfovibrio sp.]|jgi:thiol-disulfide isomerase/thioredoxin|nr:TlpA family protein disulfide reductase [Desulfovibrio sp.]
MRICLYSCLAALLLTVAFHRAVAGPSGHEDVKRIDASGLINLVAAENGKVVVVNIFASWCPPCREEIPGLINLRKDFSADKVTFIGVSVDKEPKALYTYLDEMHINYPVLLAAGDFLQRTGVTAVPQLLVYDRKGDLQINHRGLVQEAMLRSALNRLLESAP